MRQLSAVLNFSNRMVQARIKIRPAIDYLRQEKDAELIKTVGAIIGIQRTIKKIKSHGKDKKSATIK